MDREKVVDVIKAVFRSIIFWVLGVLLFAAGLRTLLQHQNDPAKFSTIIIGGFIFICLGLFSILLGLLLVYGLWSGQFPISKMPDELDPITEKTWFSLFMSAMIFLCIAGLLTVLWGALSMIDAQGDASRIVNMLMVIIVGLLIFALPIGLYWFIPPTLGTVSRISPATIVYDELRCKL